MTVAELIKKLEKLPQNFDVKHSVGCFHFNFEEVKVEKRRLDGKVQEFVNLY